MNIVVRLSHLLVMAASLFTVYVFASLSITADELYGTAQRDGPGALYYFPVIGPYHLWPSWVMVFTALAAAFFSAWFLGYAYHATRPNQPSQKTVFIGQPPYFANLSSTDPIFETDPETTPPQSTPAPPAPQAPAPTPSPDVPRGTVTPKPTSLSLDDL